MADTDDLPLDLNDPDDARAYVLGWVDAGALTGGTAEITLRFAQCSDEEIMRVARQLFLHHDPRPVLGEEGH